MRSIYLAIAFGLSFGFVAQSANAQFPQSQYQTQPAVSPYLNLNRGGANLATNYFGIVRPQIDTRNSIQSLQSQINTLGAGSPTDPLATELATGHTVQFMNYSMYFGHTPGAEKNIRTAGNSGPGQPSRAGSPPTRAGAPASQNTQQNQQQNPR